MPPSGSPSQSNAGQITQNGEPYYSNEDIAILHDIVVLSQELLPKLPVRERLPTNALFSAYYDILPRIGVAADHDSRYARVLFKIGGLRGPATLYEKFEEILSRMGIEIEFDRDEDEDQPSQLDDSQNDLEIVAANTSQEDIHKTRERKRRNSESTIWDLGIESQSQSRKRRNSFSTISKANNQVDGRTNFLQDSPPAPASPIDNVATHQNKNEDYPTDNVRPWLNSRAGNPRRGRGRSVSTHASMRIRRRSPSGAFGHRRPETDHSVPPSDEYNTASEITAVTSVVEDDDTKNAARSFQGYSENQVNPSLMEIKASLMLRHHLSSLIKQQWKIWREKAVQIRQDSRGLDLIAASRDRKVLVQGALADWRRELQSKRMITETELFFSHLERRATRARDLYLMHKAFTHHSACANEQVQRTALARRHIVRTRVFNAWRDITAVNELKVRRQVLKKFFSIWKQQHATGTSCGVAAVQRYEGYLVQRNYRSWVQKHWEIKAIAWWAESIKRQALFRWIVMSHNTWQDQRSAEETRRFQLLQNEWWMWKGKTDEQIRQRYEAEASYRTKICRKFFRKWCTESRVVPARKTVQTDIRMRLLQRTFEVWLQRSRQERQATALDRMKILREAWTNWRHESHSQIIVARLDARVLSQSIYKWLLQTRCSQFRGDTNRAFRDKYLHFWFRRSQATRQQRLELEEIAESLLVKRTQNQALRRWYSRMEQQQQLAYAAMDFHAPLLLQGVILQWSERAHHLRQLQKWSRDAEFYFIASKSLKRWKASTETVRREKRKAAYSQVRRIKKINLARGVFQNWKRQAQDIINLQEQAQQINHNKNVIVGMNIFDRWRARGEELAEMEASFQETVLRKHFILWRDRSNALNELRSEAIIAQQERQQSRAVKKWNLQALQLRAQLNYALDIRERNAKRTFRKIFTYWHQRTAQRRPVKKFEQLESSLLGNTARAEAWSDFGEEGEVDEWARGLDEAVVPTPIPGYLSTPSKRTERVMAVAARFSTTPRAPLSTPFERQLRAQYSGGFLPSLRRPPGRSTLGMGGGFADIKDRDMNDERQ